MATMPLTTGAPELFERSTVPRSSAVRHSGSDRKSVLRRVLARMASELRTWRRRSRDRRELAAMSDHSLRDIGLTRYDAVWEASKPFWRA